MKDYVILELFQFVVTRPHTKTMLLNLISSYKVSSFKEHLSIPVLTQVTQNRTTGLFIVGAAGIQTGLTALGWPGWACPFWHVLGIPCPGCGLSRATVLLLEGDWRASLNLHAFAPIFLVAFLFIAGNLVLPEKQRGWLMGRLELVERRTGITALLLVGLVVYWLVRLLVFPEAFFYLIKG